MAMGAKAMGVRKSKARVKRVCKVLMSRIVAAWLDPCSSTQQQSPKKEATS
jgi:hypothetical protein